LNRGTGWGNIHSAMEALGEIEIRINGAVGAQKLTPALVDNR
jgi:hypothetical protein